MTVAIRAFRMEMEQASHVTDVYSKVAAVTASDTEELITAMSKTASSAEAVGSSFENTTAMLAVMIESTRESATNIGSAMKSIISRYGEMKTGSTTDAEGEAIAYNKVDTALQSIGMTLKDTNGQFRDFDDVIEELASKWDTLSSVQQRYIATIFAGNRQQSRFLALVSNYDRYMEVSAAAANAEDAGLLQYSKTLDSLETKLNNLSTSFQQFYMSLANGETFGGAIEGITKFIEGLNKLGNFSAIANIVGILSSLKLVGKTAVTSFTTMTSQIKSNVETVFTQIAASMVSKMRAAGRDSARAIEEGAQQGAQGPNPNSPGKAVISPKIGKTINIASFVGTGLSIAGTGVAADNAVAGSWMTTAGSALSFGAQGAMIGSAIAPGVGTAIGTAIGVLAGALSQIPALINAYANQAQEALDKATKEAEEKNLERAQAAEDYRSLESTIENLKKLQAARYDSEEAAKAFADAQKDAAEKFPELVSGYTATGDAIVDVINGTVDAEALLADARKQAAQATLEAAKAELEKANKQAAVDTQSYEKYAEVRNSFLSMFDWGTENNQVPDTAQLPTYNEFSKRVGELNYNVSTSEKREEYLKSLILAIDNTAEYEKRLSDYYGRIGQPNGYANLDEAKYYAIIDQFNQEYGQKYSKLASTNALQASDIRTVVSSIFTDYLADEQITGDWLRNNTVNSLVGQAFRNRIFDRNGKVKDTKILDENNNVKEEVVKDYAIQFYQDIEPFLSSLTGSTLEDFVQIIEGVNKGQYTTTQLEEELRIYGVNENTNKEIYETLLAPIQETIERIKNRISTSDFDIKNIEGIDKVLERLPATILNSLSSFMTDLQNKIENKQISQGQADEILKQYTAFIAGIFNNPNLAYSQRMTAANIISQGDMTTLLGQYQIQQQLNEALGTAAPQLVKKESGKWISKVGTAVDNVVLSYQTFADSLATSVETLSDVFKNASSGFEFKDAQKIANKTGKGIKELFSFTDGKWFINPKESGGILDAYEAERTDTLEMLEQQKEADISSIKSWAGIYEAFNGNIDRMPSSGLRETYQAGAAVKDKYFNAAKAYWEQQNKGSTITFEQLSTQDQAAAIEEYINYSTEAATDAVNEYADWLREEADKNIKAAAQANEIAKRAYGDRKDWIEAFNVLKNKGSNTGFTPEEVQKIVSQGILTEDQFTVDKFGNFNLTKENYRKALIAGSQALADQYDAQMADKAKQLAEQVRTLGKNVKLGTASDTDWYSIAKEIFGIEEVDNSLLEMLKAFFENDSWSSDQIASFAKYYNISEPVLKEAYNEYVKGGALGVQDLQKQILDNYAKVLKGELTDADIAALDGEVGAAVQEFVDDTSNQISKYIEALLKSSSMSFSEMVSSLSSVYKDQLEKANPSFSSPKLLANNTRMSASQASQMLAELNLLFGEEKYTAGELFAYNIADQTYSLIGKQYERIYQDFQQKIDDRTTDPQKKAQLENFLPLLQSAASEAFFTSAQSASETVKKFATSTEMTFKDIQSIYSELGGNITAADASTLAAELNELDPWKRINRLVEIYKGFGVTLDGSKYNEIVNTVFDSILSAISNALSKLSSGLSGKLSFSDFQSLIDKGYVEASQGRVGYNGITLTNEGRQQYLTKLYQEAKQLGNTQGLGDEIWSTLSDSQNQIFDGYVEIEEEIERIQEKLSGLSKGPDKTNLQDYLALLNQVRAAAMFDPNAAEFDFMGQESTDGLTKNFDKFLSSIDTVKSAFSTLQSGGSIGYDQFYNMVDFLGKFANDGQLAKALAAKGQTINDFANAVVLSSKEIGKADLGTVAAQLGVSMSDAAQMMGGDMEQGLKAVAEQQVKYLTGLEGMLKALAAMDGLNAEAGIAFTYTVKGEQKAVRPGEILDTWKSLQGFPDKTKKEFKVAFEETYAVEFNEANATVLDKFFNESSGKMSMMTQDQITSWTQYVYSLMDPTTSPLYKDGKLITNWETVLDSVFSSALAAIDTSAYEKMLQDKIDEFFGSGTTITLTDGPTIEYKLDAENAKITITDAGGLDQTTLQTKLNEQLAARGLSLNNGTTLEGGGFEFTIKPIVESGATQSLVSEATVAETKSQLDKVEEWIEAIGDMNVSPTVSIAVKGLLKLVTAVSLLNSLKSKIGVNVGTGSGDTTGGTGSFTGTIGKAFADGSIGRLRYGAARAQETLVGELGPELAVYDGQYHLLGKNGAEFVKLPDDAIIFNHLQTQGIMRGQMNIRGTMMASGTMNSGPAMAGGNISAALAAVQRAKSVWQGLLNKLTAQDLLGSGGGGGGGGGDKTAVIQDLQEWYNLSRQIANIEQEINNIVAERENIADGGAYLRSLRQQQELLQDQVGIHKILLDYQDKQLQRQADLINNDRIWSKFLTVGEGGLLQYTVGNETNGGKGALQVLDELNKMSAEQQINYLKSIGYTYTDNDGKELKDTELVTKFFEELQKQIDEYDALYDTVHATKQTVEKLKSDIEKINEEVIQNQKDLEKVIYDVIVDAWQKQIDALDEQAKLTKEVNDNYVDGLNDALKLEQERYQQNQQIADRESMQRQLALLRRSGGSASEIASLEKQLDEKLKDEYFDNQQKAIDKIQEANEKQVQQLELQVQLQKEALDYQKENGIIWTKVYDVMAGQKDEILKFIQGNATDFFSKSTLEQEAMLTDWAKKIGIYTEDRQYQNYSKDAQNKYWATGAVWGNKNLAGLKSVFDSLSDADRKEIQDAYVSTYADAMLRGADETAANEQAAKEMAAQLSNKQKAAEQKPSTPTVETPAPVPETKKESEDYTHWTFTFNGKKHYHLASKAKAESEIASLSKALNDKALSLYRNKIIKKEEYDYRLKANAGLTQSAIKSIRSGKHSKGYIEGGLVDYTGPAIVHGTPARPEAFLNAEQTKQIREGLELGSDRGILSNLRSTISELNHAINSIVNNNVSTNEINISNGAIQISVGKLNDKYDIEDVSNDIMNRIVSIASKASNRGVNRR